MALASSKTEPLQPMLLFYTMLFPQFLSTLV